MNMFCAPPGEGEEVDPLEEVANLLNEFLENDPESREVSLVVHGEEAPVAVPLFGDCSDS